MAYWQAWCASGLGRFLQRLSTGEGAALNAIVGTTALSFAFGNHLLEKQEFHDGQMREKFERHFQHVTDHIYDTEPLILLSNLEQYVLICFCAHLTHRLIGASLLPSVQVFQPSSNGRRSQAEYFTSNKR